MRDPYEVLGVDRKANAGDIKSAYRRLAKKLHPDANKNDPKAATRFSELNAAHELLGDEDKRKAFDRGEIDAEVHVRFVFIVLFVHVVLHSASASRIFSHTQTYYGTGLGKLSAEYAERWTVVSSSTCAAAASRAHGWPVAVSLQRGRRQRTARSPGP